MEKNKYTILAIDDEKLIRDLISDLLQHYGYNAVTASSGTEAIALIKNSHFDVILCDISMPGQTGFEVFDEVKKIAPEAKFIFVSAFDNQENINKGMSMGAKAFIGKPFSPDELLDVLENILKN
ncbi:MAG: hypothetical protein A2452_08410 [Candidatus Firestonebacteria bacterium RIFOXYC2_FULL_39_67]|nr:MAG: hypothetical protein A2536_05395 [Candidatus Firestonebacteria bacterium RIFOXYD2_FULL_39_29]OGF56936.1 MAG: hypothetical protein A2452_08410 [Candidatus Firestonebacteria bacterium RIFOXYC2_FULL_39_67]